MHCIKDIRQIDDVQILKDKIIKVDTIFALVGEKQNKISSLESKCKKLLKENARLTYKNNELLGKINTYDQEKKQQQDDHQADLIARQQKYDQLEHKLTKRIKRIKDRQLKKLQSTRTRFIKIVNVEKRKYRDASNKKYSLQLQQLRKIIKHLRKQISCSPTVNTASTADKENTAPVKIKPELETYSSKEEEICDTINVEAILDQMLDYPKLLSPFSEVVLSDIIFNKSVGIQTAKSTVTRPIQTDLCSMSLNKSSTNVVSIGIQCVHESEKAMQRTTHVQTVQTETKCQVTETQTEGTVTKSVSSQCSLAVVLDSKVTLKRAVNYLKQSHCSIGIHNGKLTHYSKKSTNCLPMANIVYKNVMRRLTKYIDQHYGKEQSRNLRKRMHGNILQQTTQLERSRNLMLYHQRLMDDTDSSGYDSRVDIGISPQTLEPTKPCIIINASNSPDTKEIEEIFNYVSVPQVISPLKDDEDSTNNELEAFEESRQEIDMKESMKKEEVPIKVSKKQSRVNSLANIQKRIKQCNKISISNITVSSDNPVIETRKKRIAHKTNEQTSRPLDLTQQSTFNLASLLTEMEPSSKKQKLCDDLLPKIEHNKRPAYKIEVKSVKKITNAIKSPQITPNQISDDAELIKNRSLQEHSYCVMKPPELKVNDEQENYQEVVVPDKTPINLDKPKVNTETSSENRLLLSHDDDNENLDLEVFGIDNVKKEDILKRKQPVTYIEISQMLNNLARLGGDEKLCKLEYQTLRDLDTDHLNFYIMHYIKSDTSEVDEPKSPVQPRLTIKQKVLIGALCYLERENQKQYIIPLMKLFEKYLLFSKIRTVDALENLARVYAAMNRISGRLPQVRMFLLDLLYLQPKYKFSIFYTVIKNWPRLLRQLTDNYKGAGIDRALAYVILKQTHIAKDNQQHTEDDDQEFGNIGVMKQFFNIYYRYPKESYCEENLMSEFLEAFMCGGGIEYEVAMVLMCVYQPGPWIYKKIELIGELCKVSKDREIVKSLLQLIDAINSKLPSQYQEKVQNYKCGLNTCIEIVQQNTNG